MSNQVHCITECIDKPEIFMHALFKEIYCGDATCSVLMQESKRSEDCIKRLRSSSHHRTADCPKKIAVSSIANVNTRFLWCVVTEDDLMCDLTWLSQVAIRQVFWAGNWGGNRRENVKWLDRFLNFKMEDLLDLQQLFDLLNDCISEPDTNAQVVCGSDPIYTFTEAF